MLPGAIFTFAGLSASASITVSVGCGVGIMVAVGRRWYRQTITRIESHSTHLRSAIGIAATAGGMPTYWTEHAMTPETLAQIQHVIGALGIRRVIELGSGLSTLVIAHSFRRTGEGKVLSIDDDARWAAQTKNILARENLEAFAGVRVVAMKEITAGDRAAPWYNLSSLDPQARFDIVIVDGPPAWKGDSLARLPALYELRRHLGENGMLVLDDAARPGEREIARQWQRDFPELYFRMVNIGRGLFVASVDKASLDFFPL